jgi:small conductance mechanosensitive channel
MTANPVNYLLDSLMQVGPAILIFLVGYFLARRLQGALSRRLNAITALDDREVGVVAGIAFWVVLVIAALIAMATLGFRFSSLLSFISIAAVVLVIAFQQSLSAFAATVIFYVFRVVRLGDYVESMGQEGSVQEVHLFHSTLRRPDGKLVSLPHNKMLDVGVINRTRAGSVRAEVRFDLAYGQDMDAVTERVLAWIRKDPRVQESPPPEVTVGEITVMAVQKLARATIQWQDVNAFQFDLKQRIAEIVAEDRVQHSVTPAPAPPVR